MSVPARAYLSIGEVLSKLRGDFPDITISKIRFLESEGLIEPQRTPSGYRKFTSADLERLRYVLLAQRDHYLPLRVIKENLDAMDRGLVPAKSIGAVATPRLASQDGVLTADQFASNNDVRLTRSELLAASNLSDDQLKNTKSLYTNKNFFEKQFYPKFAERFVGADYRTQLGDDMMLAAEHYDSYRSKPKKVPAQSPIGFKCTGLDANGNPIGDMVAGTTVVICPSNTVQNKEVIYIIEQNALNFLFTDKCGNQNTYTNNL